MILRIVQPNQLRPLVAPLSLLFADFLRQAGEPFTVEHQWTALLRGLARNDEFLFLVALNMDLQPTAFLTAFTGEDLFGVRFASVMQVYVAPGTERVVSEFSQRLEQFARDHGSHVLSGLTHHAKRSFGRWIRRLGWEPYAMMYVKSVPEKEGVPSGEAAAAPTATGH